MIDQAISALIIAGGGIVSAVIGAFGKGLYDERGQYKIPKDRQEAISGDWDGKIANIDVVNDPPSSLETTISCTFGTGRKKVKGHGHFVKDGKNYDVFFSGYFYDKRYIRLEYNHKAPMYAFGHIILKLDDPGTSMSGKVVGYGAGSGKIIVGTIDVNKKA